jgi:hypothetical protein
MQSSACARYEGIGECEGIIPMIFTLERDAGE